MHLFKAIIFYFYLSSTVKYVQLRIFFCCKISTRITENLLFPLVTCRFEKVQQIEIYQKNFHS